MVWSGLVWSGQYNIAWFSPGSTLYNTIIYGTHNYGLVWSGLTSATPDHAHSLIY